MISGSNTSPALTSDLAGTAGETYRPGYYRTSHNDLYQSVAMAEFVYNDLGLATAAAIHDGDPYTQGLAQAFADAFEALGGTVTGFTGVSKEDTDMVPVLTEVAADCPRRCSSRSSSRPATSSLTRLLVLPVSRAPSFSPLTVF